MGRINKRCPGDCSKCELLENREVEMVPCILDQIFQSVRNQNKEISLLKSKIENLEKNADSKLDLILASDYNTPLPESEEEEQ